MNHDLINTCWLAFSFLGLFGLAELLYHKYKIKAEYTRKFVHLGTGLLTFLFPVFLSSHWWVMVLCSSFAFILMVSYKFNLLKSINTVDRITWGSLCYPAAVYVCFLAYEFNDYLAILFYLPILILAICDPLAALSGCRWPLGKYSIFGNTKSLLGSIVFAIAALCISVPFFLKNNYSFAEAFGFSLAVAIVSSIAEALSNKGFDNIFIPFSVLGICLLIQ